MQSQYYRLLVVSKSMTSIRLPICRHRFYADKSAVFLEQMYERPVLPNLFKKTAKLRVPRASINCCKTPSAETEVHCRVCLQSLVSKHIKRYMYTYTTLLQVTSLHSKLLEIKPFSNPSG